MKRKIVLTTCIVACLLDGGCHGSGLTRRDAKRILEKVAAQQSFTEISLSAAQLQKLLHVKNGAPFFDIVQPRSAKRCLPDSSDARIIMGQFVLCQNPISAGEITSDHPGVLVTLKTPVKWFVVEVTGITAAPGAQNDKIVEDTWQFDLSSFPKEIQEPLKTPPLRGKALLRLYDDGWRFVQFM